MTPTDDRKQRKLGGTQAGVLKHLISPAPGSPAGEWYDGCGWIWGTHSEMHRTLEALVKRGLVEKAEETYGEPYRGGTRRRIVYRVTDAGRAEAAAF
jgi:hypothetical protein